MRCCARAEPRARAELDEEAAGHLTRCADLCHRLGDVPGEGHAHLILARVWGQQDDYRRAKHHAGVALDLYRKADEPAREALALNQLGWVCAHLGEYDEALAHCEAALPIHRAADDAMPSSLAETYDSIGFIHERRGAPYLPFNR